MTKYKLTTDLIKDCMALIPQNEQILNKDNTRFNIYEQSSLIVYAKYPTFRILFLDKYT